MRIEDQNKMKELSKKLVEKNNNYNDVQKEVLKFILDLFYEDRKNSILKSEEQAKYIESIINDNKNNNSDNQ